MSPLVEIRNYTKKKKELSDENVITMSDVSLQHKVSIHPEDLENTISELHYT